MHDPHLKLIATHSDARTYHLQSTERLGGWAFCTVNDTIGELHITSDWGNWSHIWNPKYLGCPSLTHFIVDRKGYDYLANKLLRRRETRVLDAKATITKWRKLLTAARLQAGREVDPTLTAVFAREIWEEIEGLIQDEGNESIFIEHALQIDGFQEYVCSEPWESTEHRDSHEYRMLVDHILPTLAVACSGTLKEAQANV